MVLPLYAILLYFRSGARLHAEALDYAGYVPLAGWRVHATAAEVYDGLGQATEAGGYRRCAADGLRTLAASLGEARSSVPIAPLPPLLLS